MKPARSIRILALVLAFLLTPDLVQGHYLGTVRLRGARGPFIITVFTSSELVSGRAADISLLIQRREANEVVLDAVVSFVLTPPRDSLLKATEPMCGHSGLVERIIIPAKYGQSPNKLLYAAPVNFPLAGLWTLDASVRRGADSTQFTCDIPVGLPARPLTGLIPFLALPPFLAALFAMNQWLRGSYRRK